MAGRWIAGERARSRPTPDFRGGARSYLRSSVRKSVVVRSPKVHILVDNSATVCDDYLIRSTRKFREISILSCISVVVGRIILITRKCRSGEFLVEIGELFRESTGFTKKAEASGVVLVRSRPHRSVAVGLPWREDGSPGKGLDPARRRSTFGRHFRRDTASG